MAVMGRIWAGKGAGLVHRHSSEIRRRGSAWRRPIRRLCETRGLQGGHLLRSKRVEIEGKSRATSIRYGAVGGWGERLRESGRDDVGDVVLPVSMNKGGWSVVWCGTC